MNKYLQKKVKNWEKTINNTVNKILLTAKALPRRFLYDKHL